MVYYCPKRKAYKVLRYIIRRAVLPILTGVFLLWVCSFVLFRDHQPQAQLNIPRLAGPVLPSLDQDGFYVRDKNRFMKRYRLDPSINKSNTFREFLLYGTFDNMEDFPELNDILGVFTRGIPGAYWKRAIVSCPRQQSIVGVTVSTQIEEFQTKDAVVFGMMPKTLAKNLKTLVNTEPAAAQTWIYMSTESPFRAMRWVKDSDLARLNYHKLMTYNSKADIPLPFGYTVINDNSSANKTYVRRENLSKGKSKLIAWIASNCEEVFWPRNEFVERIRELVRVDTYGRCGSMDCVPRGSDRCQQMLGDYKFYLALANTECRDYITEKFWNTALQHGIVPVVGGAPRDDFERVAPASDSFIHIGDFRSVKELVQYLLLLDSNDALYNRYFAWKQTSSVVINFPPGPDIFCQILPHLKNMSTKVMPPLKKLGDSPWFQTCRNKVSISSAVRIRSRILDNEFDTWTPWRL